jgi:PAS domain S-box-containing protein
VSRELPEPDYRELVERAGDMIYTLDLDGRFTYANAAGVAMLGYSLEQLIGRHFIQILTTESQRVALEHFERGMRGAELTPFFEVQAIRGDGEHIDVEIRAATFYRDGKVAGRQGVARDISQLKHLQAEVAEKSQRLMLLENQAQVAMNLYRRIAELALDAPDDPAGTHRALRTVQDSLAAAVAEKYGFTETDLAVIALLAKGLSNREIAADVHLSPNTIKDRVSKIMRALGARSRAEAVAHAASHGLIGD